MARPDYLYVPTYFDPISSRENIGPYDRRESYEWWRRIARDNQLVIINYCEKLDFQSFEIMLSPGLDIESYDLEKIFSFIIDPSYNDKEALILISFLDKVGLGNSLANAYLFEELSHHAQGEDRNNTRDYLNQRFYQLKNTSIFTNTKPLPINNEYASEYILNYRRMFAHEIRNDINFGSTSQEEETKAQEASPPELATIPEESDSPREPEIVLEVVDSTQIGPQTNPAPRPGLLRRLVTFCCPGRS